MSNRPSSPWEKLPEEKKGKWGQGVTSTVLGAGESTLQHILYVRNYQIQFAFQKVSLSVQKFPNPYKCNISPVNLEGGYLGCMQELGKKANT